MDLLDQLRKAFTLYLEENRFTQYPPELYEPNNYFLNIGGKRLRPIMVLLGTDLFGGDISEALPAAMSIEYFHNFSLVHDDVMDNAPIRRGHTTIHEKYGLNTAILSGDALLVYAYDFLEKVPEQHLRTILRIFNRTAIEVCEGQQMDMNFEKRVAVSEEEYLDMIRRKTSVVLAAALQIGAIIGGAEQSDADALYQYALHLGLAFQIQDDILDCYGDQQLVGKQPGGDILQNKKTLLLIRAMEAAELHQDIRLSAILSGANVLSPEQKVAAVLEIYADLGIRTSVTETRDALIEKALSHLYSTTLPDNKKRILESLVHQLVLRTF